MSRTASLPGADFFSGNVFFLKNPLVPGNFAAWAVLFYYRNSTFSGESHLSGATSLPRAELVLGGQTFLNNPLSGQPGQNFSQVSDFCLNKPLVWGSCAAWGSFFLKNQMFLIKPLVWGSCAARGRTFPRNPTFLLEGATCPAASLPGAGLFREIRCFLKKQLVRGSCAAWGSTASQKCVVV